MPKIFLFGIVALHKRPIGKIMSCAAMEEMDTEGKRKKKNWLRPEDHY